MDTTSATTRKTTRGKVLRTQGKVLRTLLAALLALGIMAAPATQALAADTGWGTEPGAVDGAEPTLITETVRISEGGSYALDAALNDAVITIDTTAPVELIGRGIGDGTLSGPSSLANQYITVTGATAGIDLTLNDVFFNGASTTSVLDFQGAGNTLTFVGTSDLETQQAASLIHVPPTAGLTVEGAGTVYLYKSATGAGIGGDANEASGAITWDGPTLFAKGTKMGAVFGSGGYGIGTPGDITIKSGELNLIGNARGAILGTGASATSVPGNVYITGGSVNFNVDFSGAAIGNGNNSPVGGKAYITGGSVRVYIDDNAVGSWRGSGATEAGVSPVAITSPTLDARDEATYMLAFDTTTLEQAADSFTVSVDGDRYYQGGLHRYWFVQADKDKDLGEQIAITTTPSNWILDPNPDPNLYLFLTGEDHDLVVNGVAFHGSFDAETSTFELEVSDVTGPGTGIGIGELLTVDSAEGVPVTYKVLTEDTDARTGTVQVGDGSSAAIDTVTTGGVTIPGTVEGGDLTYTITGIGNGAFINCASLTSVVIPDSVTSIGNTAFRSTGLTSVTIPNSVTSIGDSAFYFCRSLTSLVIPDSVTSIGNNAFYDCETLTSATLPAGITSIPVGLFHLCEKLASVTIPTSVESIGQSAFRETALTSVTIPDSVTSMGDYAFSDCTSLTSAVIGNSVESIGTYAFSGCGSLISLTLGSSVKSLGSRAFLNCASLTSLVIPDSVTSIGTYAISGCTRLASVTIGSSVASFSNNAFRSCSSLGTLTFRGTAAPTMAGATTFSGVPSSGTVYYPEGATGYTDGRFATAGLPAGWAFVAVTGTGPGTGIGVGETFTVDSAEGVSVTYKVLTEDTDARTGTVQVGNGSSVAIDTSVAGEVTIPGTVEGGDLTYTITGIGNGAFINCASLTSVVIPDSVTSIGNTAFRSTGLTSVTIPNSVTSIGDSAFHFCRSLTSVTIPNSVTSIGGSAFYDCDALTSVTLPAGITSIPSGMFQLCDKLTSITIPSSVQSIGQNAFRETALTSVIIPDSVADMGTYTFYGCTALTSAAIGNSVESVGTFAFSGCTALTSVTLGSSVKSLASRAFENCASLTSLVIPDSVTSIGTYAISGCTRLASVTIGSSVASFSNNAFRSCSSLGTLTFRGTAAPTMAGTSTFLSVPSSGTVYYPEGATGYTDGRFATAGLPAGWAFVAVTGTSSYAITIADGLEGGTVTADVAEAQAGATVTLTVTPTEGYQLADGSLKVNDGVVEVAATEDEGTFTFTMPAESVTVTATFEATAGVGVGNVFSANNADDISITYKVLTEDGGTRTGTVEVGSDNPYWVSAIARDTFGSLVIPGTVEGNGITYTVKGIGEYALYNCVSLTSVVLPDTVETISTLAFDDCRALESVTFGSSVQSIGQSAFYNCASLASVVIPDSVQSIGDNAFYNCASLTSAVIGNSAQSIGRSAFGRCENLTSVTFGSSVQSIGQSAFQNCVSLPTLIIPASVTSIEGSVFGYCSSLTTLVFEGNTAPALAPTTFNNIPFWGTLYHPEGAQGYDDENLRAAGLPADWRILVGTGGPDLTFYTVTAEDGITDGVVATDVAAAQIGTTVTLTVTPAQGYKLIPGSLKVSSSVTGIGLAVAGDEDTFTFTMPGADVTVTAAFVLAGSAGVDGVFVVESAEGVPVTYRVLSEQGSAGTIQVGDGTGENSTVSKAIAMDYAGPLTLPNAIERNGMTYTVTSVGTYAFHGCTGLTSVNIPSGVTRINNYAFKSCSSLGAVTLPDAVERVDTDAFEGCASLTSFIFPDNVTRVGRNALAGCTSLTTVTFGSSVDNIRENAVYDDKAITSLIFKGSVAPSLAVGEWTGALAGLSVSGTLYYPEGAQGYDPSVFQTASLGKSWVFEPVPSGPTEPEVGEPGSGDLDGDGKATASEALQIARAVISGIGDLTPAQIAAVDMDGDGVLTMSDVVRVLRVAAGL